jgi:hypothetical protein
MIGEDHIFPTLDVAVRFLEMPAPSGKADSAE